MFSLYIRNIIFFFLQPGIVVGLIPYILVKDKLKLTIDNDFKAINFIGLVIIVLGLCIVVNCIYRFIIEGKGTLSPVDRTKTLVVKGLYNYSRNPMYVGVLLILLGEAIFIKSLLLFGYLLLVYLTFSLFVIFVEEPRLKRDFKNDYALYSSRVNRWF